MIFEILFVLCLAAARIDSQVQECSGKPDGPCCAGCHSYTVCTGGVGEIFYCPLPDYAYNELIEDCDLMENTPPPCGSNHNCSGLPNGKYPDMSSVGQECESYFTCSNGINLGVNPCNPPESTADLVFHYQYQICNWRNQVPPPCGTLGVSPLPPLRI